MKKSTLLKLALSVVTLFVFFSVNAQNNPALYTATQITEATMYQTQGTNFRLYVEPDAVYSPSFDKATNNNVNPASYWLFTISAGLTAVTPADLSVRVNQNWVELTATTNGSQTVAAQEALGAAGCIDALPITQNITVIAAPSAQIGTADPAVACGDQAAAAVAIQFTEDVPTALATYAFAVNELIENLDDVSGTNPVTLTATHTFVDEPLTSKGVALGAASPFTYTFNTSALNVLNSKPTRYTYTLVEPTDLTAGADGFVSAVSHKSDYLTIAGGGSPTKHAYVGKLTYVVIVAPIPTTGPIYHLPNNYNI